AHYVTPLPTILPLRSRLGGVVSSILRFLGWPAKLNDRGSLITGLGLTLYDFFGRNFRVMPKHRMLSRARLDRIVAGLDRRIIGAGLYYEGQISHAERLGLELVLDGEAMNPNSSALNYVTVEGEEEGIVSYVHNGQKRHVRPRVIVNAGGAWIDRVNASLGIPTQLMGGSKGAHLVVENPALYRALNGHMIYFGTADGRVNLVYPFMGQVLLGSTDIKTEDPDTAVCDNEEADYLRGVVAEIFPDIPVTADQIRHRFSGVRPLPRADGDIGLVTRDHSIAERTLPSGTPVLCLIGGKWTTFRGFSAQVSDQILKLLGRQRHRSTEAMQIGGGKDYPLPDQRAGWVRKHAGESGLSIRRMENLLERYGTRAAEIANELGSDCPLETVPDYSQEELSYLIRNERVGHVDDLLYRRTTIAISGALSPETRQEVELLYEKTRRSSDVH
ncbi:FAD-dependent oxidoreductase, partial [Marivita sp.]